MRFLNFRNIKQSLRNARRSFRTGEVGYHLQIGRFNAFSIAYRGGTVDERVIAHSFENDTFFARAPELEPGRDGVVIDIGAHIGTFALLAAFKAPEGRVHAIEASQETFNYLTVNCALNPSLPVTAHHLALSGESGTVALSHDPNGNWGNSITKQMSGRSERVQALTLEEFMNINGIDAATSVKFNCEGAEFPILMTTKIATLRRIQMMVVLYHLHLVDGYTLDDLLARLHEAGFSTDLRNQTRTKGWIVATR